MPGSIQLSSDDDVARTIHAVHLEYVLGEINADGANLHVDDPPPVIRCSTITLLAHSMPVAGVVHHINRVTWPSADYFRSSPANGRRRGQ